jgi:A/G-specific adenine glycosylase
LHAFVPAVSAFRRSLLRWYDANRRDLPWRRTSDPYRIWLSEIMLQQTRVAAVLEHYRVFLERFPDVASLASAPEPAVLAAWSGLGYYRRARMLHQCARRIVERYSGRFPTRADKLRDLPGIGRYTAAAIASIAFAEPVAVVDGNVQRVLERFLGCNVTPASAWDQAQRLLSPSRPGDFNQAMMELGATVCRPRQPMCGACPVRKMCATKGEVPRTKTPALQTKRLLWCALDCRDGRIRLVQRSERASLMPGMWELPNWPAAGANGSTLVQPWRTFRHSITVTDYTVHVARGTDARNAKRDHGRWIAIGRLSELPITGLTRKILRADGII